MRRCVRHSKKRTQASPDQAVGDPTRVQRPVVRVAHGRDPGPLRRALRSKESRSVLRRETLPALLAEVRESLACKPGKPKRVDFEYERRGMANVLLAFEPLKQGPKRNESDRAPPKAGICGNDALPGRGSLSLCR